MPAPLPPLKKADTPRLSFLPGAKVAPLPGSGGIPTDPMTIQLQAEFDPIGGEGEWRFIHFPQDVPFDDYDQFERFCKRHLPVQEDQFSYLMDYLHNFKVLNFDLRTGEVYPVIPTPRGYNVPIPIPGAPGPYLGGGGEGS